LLAQELFDETSRQIPFAEQTTLVDVTEVVFNFDATASVAP